MPSPGNTQTSIPRPEIAQAIVESSQMSDVYVASRVLPIMPVGISTGPIPKLLRAQRASRVKKAKGVPTATAHVYIGDGTTFNCEERAVKTPIDVKDAQALGSQARAEEVAASQMTDIVLRDREIEVAALIQNTTTFPAAQQQAAAFAWNNASADARLDVANAKDKLRLRCGREANTIIIPRGAKLNLDKQPNIQNYLRTVMGYTDKMGGVAYELSVAALRATFQIENVILAGAIKDTSDEGGTDAPAYIWASDKILVAYINPSEFVGPNLGVTFSWDEGNAPVPGTALMSTDPLHGLSVDSWYDIDAKCQFIRSYVNDDPVVLNANAGVLITGA